MTLSKNINALRLAGLLTETEALAAQGLLAEQDPMAGGDPAAGAGGPPPGSDPGAGGPPPGGDEGGQEDPSALLDQAIELLNKVKSSMGGGENKEATPPPQGF